MESSGVDCAEYLCDMLLLFVVCAILTGNVGLRLHCCFLDAVLIFTWTTSAQDIVNPHVTCGMGDVLHCLTTILEM